MLVVALVGWLAWRDTGARMGPGLRLGVLSGFAASTVLTVVTAGILSSNGGHFVGIPGPDAGTLPLFGWSTAVGDLGLRISWRCTRCRRSRFWAGSPTAGAGPRA